MSDAPPKVVVRDFSFFYGSKAALESVELTIAAKMGGGDPDVST